MKRHPALIQLSKDHHQGLLLAQVLIMKDKAYPGYPFDLEGKAEYTIAFFKTELIKHFRIEEEILFPLVRSLNDILDNLINELISEHQKFFELIQLIKDNRSSFDNLYKIGTLLESHIRKEERQLFEMIQELADEKLMTDIKEKIENYEYLQNN